VDECKPLIAGMEAWLAEPNLMEAWAYTRSLFSSTQASFM
jgi:hypothetical protein